MLFINVKKERADKESALNKLKGSQRSKTPVRPQARQQPMPALQVDKLIRDRLDISERAGNGSTSNDQNRIDARNNLKSYCYNMIEKMDEGYFDKNDKNTMMTLVFENYFKNYLLKSIK